MVIQEKNNIKLMNWELVSVNPRDKNWDWKNLFCFWGNLVQSIIGFSLITSLYLIYEMNVSSVFFGTLAGSILVIFLSNLIGRPSQKHGIPFSVFLRTSLGIVGAKYIALLRGVVAIFMFGVQTFFLSKSIGYLITVFLIAIDSNLFDKEIFNYYYFSLSTIDWFSLLFAIVIQVYLFRLSQSFNKFFINFSAIIVYIGLILFCVIIASTNLLEVTNSFKEILVFENIFIKKNMYNFLTVIGTTFAYFSIVIINFGDFSRYVKNEKELKKGNYSLFFNMILFSFFAIFIVVGADSILNKSGRLLVNPTDIIGSFDNVFLSIVVVFFILFATASTNLIVNFIPSQYSLINFLPDKLTPNSSGIIIGVLAFFIGGTWISILSQIGILSIVDTIGSFFGPMFGILIANYYVVTKQKIINKDLFSSSETGSYYFSKGWHLKALYSLFIAFIFSASTIWNPELRFLQSASWLIGALVSFVTYYLLSEK